MIDKSDTIHMLLHNIYAEQFLKQLTQVSG